MPPRLEIAPGCFTPCEPLPWSMDARQRILDAISDPSVKKMLVMRWWEAGEIAPTDAQQLIRGNDLEAA